jgi:hypothetical protein
VPAAAAGSRAEARGGEVDAEFGGASRSCRRCGEAGLVGAGIELSCHVSAFAALLDDDHIA